MKKRMNFIGVFVASIMLIGLLSCESKEETDSKRIETSLELSGDNKSELEKILKHYQEPKDSLKLRAAKFLIINMAHHSYTEVDHRYDTVFKSIERVKIDSTNKLLRRRRFKRNLIKCKRALEENEEYRSYKKVKDIEVLTAGFLIDNIELAFDAWCKIPKSKRASFDDFCNYVLPYRSTNEPIEKDSRLRLYEKYAWVYDEINKGVTLESITKEIVSKFEYTVFGKISNHYSLPLSVGQMEMCRLGMCDDGVNYFVNVFRALGIACSKDYVSHWGNHHSSGHSWLYVKLGEEDYATDFKGESMKEKYKKESIARVNRISFEYQKSSSFSSLSTDVTSTYVKTTDIKVSNEFNIDIETPVLCVFDKRKEWEVVNGGVYSWGKSEFVNVGVYVLYLSGSLNNYGEIIPTNYPFYIDEKGKINYFKTEGLIIESAVLLRKYGLSSPKGTDKIDWIKGLNGSEIQVSNDKGFEDYKIIHKIENMHSTHLQKVKTKDSNKYKFIRFKSNNKEESYLATLAFYGKDMKKLKGNVFKENMNSFNKDHKRDASLDHKANTFTGGVDFIVGMEFDKPIEIEAIGYQARNDTNHITEGDDYELFFWDKEWKSLGEQKARDTVLYYDVPANSLFWLKNNTKGKEEHVFTIDNNKKQQWLGFDNDF